MALTALTQRESTTQYGIAVEKQSFDGRYSPSSVIVTISVALALYNSLEMVLLILTTFKRWRGLYFWSLTLCNFGVFAYTIGMMLSYFELCILWLSKTWLDVGWMSMIICQSLVLYSRLGLIIDNVKIVMGVKWMIVISSFVFLVPTVVLDFACTYSKKPSFSEAYFYMEHIQMTGITIQELVISSLYLWKTSNLLKVISKANARSMVWQLFTINVVIIGMDIALIVLEYKHLQLYQESIKAFVYSVKLKLELNILSKLVDLVNRDSISRSMTLDVINPTTLSGQAQSEIRGEMSELGPFMTSTSTDEKGRPKHRHSSCTNGRDFGDPFTQKHPDGEQITTGSSHDSNSTQPTNRRRSDDLYAEALRTLT